MRNLFRHVVMFLGLCLLLVGMAHAQSVDPFLERFALQNDNGKVLLDWVTRPGTTCEGVDVMRSVDSLQWNVIHHIPGICGGPDDAYPYQFRDEAPVPNRRNFYRLGLGRLGESQVRSIEVVDLPTGTVQARPNPITEAAKIYFENPNYAECTLQVVDMHGVKVATYSARDEFVTLEAFALLPGLYAVQVHDPDGRLLAHGKIVVAR